MTTTPLHARPLPQPLSPTGTSFGRRARRPKEVPVGERVAARFETFRTMRFSCSNRMVIFAQVFRALPASAAWHFLEIAERSGAKGGQGFAVFGQADQRGVVVG